MSHDRDPLNGLNELAQLRPDVSATERAVERAQAALRALPMVSPVQGSAARNWSTKLWRPQNLLVAAAAVLLAFVAQWFLTRSDSNFAFAQVQAQVAKIKSVQFRQFDKVLANGEISYEGSSQTAILGANLSREEVHVKKQPKSEEPLRGSHSIQITNSKTKTTLCLYPEEKEYSLFVSKNMVPGRDLYRMFRDVPADQTEKLPERILNGKKVVNFLLREIVDHPDDKTQWMETTMYWVDTATKLPVQIQYSGRNNKPDAHESYETVRTDFVFDAPLDESLFSTEPPKGWKDISKRFEVPIK